MARVPDLGARETRQAIEAAARAFPAWSRKLAKERAAILRRWYELQIAHARDLALLMTREQGKPLAEARAEVDYAASFTEFFAEEAKRVYGEIIPTHRQSARSLVIKQPVGVVGAITPWNFPLAMITRTISPARAAGCTVVIKPAPETPLSALALAELGMRAGFPPGGVNVVTGDAVSIGGELTANPLVRMITFTGSTEVGKLLMRQAADTVKKLSSLKAMRPSSCSTTPTSKRRSPARLPPNTAIPARLASAPIGSWCRTRSMIASRSGSWPRSASSWWGRGPSKA
jgi:succinate-semialdehyde dehydrogenase/glutarate-semialdehyde dehydrogenase